MHVFKSQKCKHEHLELILALSLDMFDVITIIIFDYSICICRIFDCNKYEKLWHVCTVLLPWDPMVFPGKFKKMETVSFGKIFLLMHHLTVWSILTIYPLFKEYLSWTRSAIGIYSAMWKCFWSMTFLMISWLWKHSLHSPVSIEFVSEE